MWLFRFPRLRLTLIARRQKLACHFLGRGLARTAGDGHDLRSRRAPDSPAQLLQRHCGVVHLDDDCRRGRRRPRVPAARNHDASGTRADCRSRELAAVKTLAADGDEQRSRRLCPRVDRHAREFPRSIARYDHAVHLPGDPGRRERERHCRRPSGHTTPELVRRRAKASSATSTSSNGRVRSPITR